MPPIQDGGQVSDPPTFSPIISQEIYIESLIPLAINSILKVGIFKFYYVRNYHLILLI